MEKNRFKQDLEIIPLDPLLNKKMGDVFFAEKNFLAAAEKYKQVIFNGGEHLAAEIILKFQKAILHHPQEINQRLALVEFYIAAEDKEEVVEELEELLEIQPANINALNQLASISRYMQNKERLIPILEKAVDNSLADQTLLNILTSYYIELDRLPEVISVYERLLERKPGDTGLIQNIIEMNLRLKNYAQVANHLGQLLQKNPGLSAKVIDQAEEALVHSGPHKELYYILARALLKDLKPGKAVLYYEKILKVFPGEAESIEKAIKELLITFPDFPEAQLLLAQQYITQENYSEAVSLFNKVVRSNPALYGEEVIQGYLDVLRVCPNQALAIQSLGEIYIAKKEYGLAVEKFQILLELTPEARNFIIQKCKKMLKSKQLASVRQLLGEAYLQKQNYNKAIEEADQLIKSAPDHGGGYEILGKALLATGKIEQAIERLRTALGLNPYNKGIHKAYRQAQEQKLMIQVGHLKEQLVQDPWKLSLHFLLGKAYFLLGRIEDAVPELQTALKDISRAKEAYALLGMAFKEQGRYDLAALQFQQALSVAQKYLSREERLKLILYQAMASEAFGEVPQALENYEKVAIEDARFKNVAAHVENIKKVPSVETRGKILLGVLTNVANKKFSLLWVHNKEAEDYAEKKTHSPISFSLDHNNHGVENALKDRIGEAKKDFNLAASLDKNLTAAYNNLALLAMQEENWVEAEQLLNKAIFLNPKLGVLFANKALWHQLQGDKAKAQKLYHDALALNENLHGAEISLGELLYQEGKISEAMVYWQRALELSCLPELAQRRLIWKQA
ncbi:tetratricopeptide repeat protein [Candidatus Margulisiibacteriota bacterium]